MASVWLRGIVQLCQPRCDDSIDSKGGDREAIEIKASDSIESKRSEFPPSLLSLGTGLGSDRSDSYKQG